MPLVIVGGGDGTIRTVLPALARRDVVLGILPLGTANNFARSVGVPMDSWGRSTRSPTAGRSPSTSG